MSLPRQRANVFQLRFRHSRAGGNLANVKVRGDSRLQGNDGGGDFWVIIKPMPDTAISPAKAKRLTMTAARQTRARKPATVTAAQAQKEFAALLQTARRKTVTVTNNGKPAAVVMSARRYRDLMEFFEELEERIWVKMALEAEKEGMATREESDALMRDLLKCAKSQKNGG